jgi:Mrp family chromosome partitioning ATPase
MDPSVIVHSQRMKKLMKSMKDAAGSGFVIVDLPPVLAADDVIALLPQLDCILMVVAAGETIPAEIEECDRLLSAANSVDIVLNKSDEADHSYYY